MNRQAAGLRKSSWESLGAHKIARIYREAKTPIVTRTAALQVAKRAAAALGLKAAKIALIDQLFSCSKACDWTTPGTPPVVWPSNARLARSLGLSISTMKHHLNGLVRAGLVAYGDHPTYQRRGVRDAEGNIVEAYGIDLSPIAVRFQELLELAEATEYRAREWRRLSYRRTSLRKEIQSLILGAQESELEGPWGHLQARLDVLREQQPEELADLQAQVDAFEQLREDVESAYEQAVGDRNFDSAVSKFRPIQTTAEPSKSESSNDNRRRANARQVTPQRAFGPSPDRKSDSGPSPAPAEKPPADSLKEDAQVISLPLVRDACPAVSAFAPDAFASWRAFRDSGRALCAVVGINPQVWQEAQSTLGADLAASALALTVQRSSAGVVSKPGAYLRTLVQRGRDGELHLSRSLFALAKGGSAERAATREIAVIAETPSAFPEGGISFSRWASIVREHAPKPTPDVDAVADAFRRWARQKNVDLAGATVERTFIGFCSKWRMN